MAMRGQQLIPFATLVHMRTCVGGLIGFAPFIGAEMALNKLDLDEAVRVLGDLVSARP